MWHRAKWHSAKQLRAKWHYAKWHYAKWHLAKWHSAKLHSAIFCLEAHPAENLQSLATNKSERKVFFTNFFRIFLPNFLSGTLLQNIPGPTLTLEL
jgi:hypothetical protein